jgi:hypothetical protein
MSTELELIRNLSLKIDDIDDEKASMSSEEWTRLFRQVFINKIEVILRFLKEKLEWAENFMKGIKIHDEVKTDIILVETGLTYTYPDGILFLDLEKDWDKRLYEELVLAREYLTIIPHKISMMENCLMYIGHN